MSKRVQVYDLKEGVEYRAFKHGRELPKRFYKKEGRLYNDGGEERGHYSGCSFVPPGREYEFEAIPKPRKKKAKVNVTVDLAQSSFSVLAIVPGKVYQWKQGYLSGDTFVLRDKRGLRFCDKQGNPGGLVNVERIALTDSFKEVLDLRKTPAKIAAKQKDDDMDLLRQRARAYLNDRIEA